MTIFAYFRKRHFPALLLLWRPTGVASAHQQNARGSTNNVRPCRRSLRNIGKQNRANAASIKQKQQHVSIVNLAHGGIGLEHGEIIAQRGAPPSPAPPRTVAAAVERQANLVSPDGVWRYTLLTLPQPPLAATHKHTARTSPPPEQHEHTAALVVDVRMDDVNAAARA